MALIGVALFGNSGHQIQRTVLKMEGERKDIKLIGACHMNKSVMYQLGDVTQYESLDQILNDDRVNLVSLCSPDRSKQAHHAIMCMNAGKHVYAEKPCALTEGDLDKILEVSQKTGMEFHEMAGTAFEEPYFSVGKIVRTGKIGEIVQVFAQKSYPYHENRVQDELIDGGLICQCGIHALRFIEHTANMRISQISAIETRYGNPESGQLRMAANISMRLENGGIACAIANYLNQPGFGRWGNECLRIFGTNGFAEVTDGGRNTRLVVTNRDCGSIKTGEGKDYFQMFVESLQNGKKMPLTMQEELAPTRWVIRAKNSAGGFSRRIEN